MKLNFKMVVEYCVLPFLVISCGDSKAPKALDKNFLKGVGLSDYHAISAQAVADLSESQKDALRSFFRLKDSRLLNAYGEPLHNGSLGWTADESNIPVGSAFDLVLKARTILRDARSASNSSYVRSDAPINDRAVCLYDGPDSSLRGEINIQGTSQTSYIKNAVIATDKPHSVLESVEVAMRVDATGNAANCRTRNEDAENAFYPYPAYPTFPSLPTQLDAEERKKIETELSATDEFLRQMDPFESMDRNGVELPKALAAPLLPQPLDPRMASIADQTYLQKLRDYEVAVKAHDSALSTYFEEVKKRDAALKQNQESVTGRINGDLSVESELVIKATGRRELRARDVKESNTREQNTNALLAGVALQSTWFEKHNGRATVRGFDKGNHEWTHHQMEAKDMGTLLQMDEGAIKTLATIGQNDLVSHQANQEDFQDFWRKQLRCAGSLTIDGKDFACDQIVNFVLAEQFKVAPTESM